MRKNLDPFDQYSDELLLRALDDVELQADDEEEGLIFMIFFFYL